MADAGFFSANKSTFLETTPLCFQTDFVSYNAIKYKGKNVHPKNATKAQRVRKGITLLVLELQRYMRICGQV